MASLDPFIKIRQRILRLEQWYKSLSAPKPIQFIRLTETAIAPTRGYENDAGWDLYVSERTEIPPISFVDVPSGIRAAFPPGVWARITGRSSTLRKRGLLVVEGVIDGDYTGPLYAGVYNLGTECVVLEVGERVAQIIPTPLVQCTWNETQTIVDSSRGSKGFGSSGK